MKPCFQLWDAATANLVGLYESVSEVLADLVRTSTTVEERDQIRDLVLTLGIHGDEGEAIIVLEGDELLGLVLSSPAFTARDLGTPERSRHYVYRTPERNSLGLQGRYVFSSSAQSYAVLEPRREFGNFPASEDRRTESAGNYVPSETPCPLLVA